MAQIVGDILKYSNYAYALDTENGDFIVNAQNQILAYSDAWYQTNFIDNTNYYFNESNGLYVYACHQLQYQGKTINQNECIPFWTYNNSIANDTKGTADNKVVQAMDIDWRPYKIFRPDGTVTDIKTSQDLIDAISNIGDTFENEGTEEHLITYSLLYNNPNGIFGTENDIDVITNNKIHQQVITNINFDKHGHLTYTYSDLKTTPETQSVSIGNSIISISVINGVLVLQQYTPVEITHIQLLDAQQNQINVNDIPGSISPLNYGEDYYCSYIKVTVTQETKTGAILIDNIIQLPDIIKGNQYHSPSQLSKDLEIGETLNNTFIIETTKLESPTTITVKTIPVRVIVQDSHEVLTNPPSVSDAELYVGWYYRIYFGICDCDKETYTNDFSIGSESKDGKITETDKFNYIYVKPIKGSIIEYESIVDFSIELYQDGYPVYILIPTSLSDNYIRFVWNGFTYQTPKKKNITEDQPNEYYTINGVNYYKYIIQSSFLKTYYKNITITGFTTR